MGLISKSQKIAAETTLEKEVIPNLVERDGVQHILMISSSGKRHSQNFNIDEKYTIQINEILTYMQEEGYEIIDIKPNVIVGSGLGGDVHGFYTLIIYK